MFIKFISTSNTESVWFLTRNATPEETTVTAGYR